MGHFNVFDISNRQTLEKEISFLVIIIIVRVSKTGEM